MAGGTVWRRRYTRRDPDLLVPATLLCSLLPLLAAFAIVQGQIYLDLWETERSANSLSLEFVAGLVLAVPGLVIGGPIVVAIVCARLDRQLDAGRITVWDVLTTAHESAWLGHALYTLPFCLIGGKAFVYISVFSIVAWGLITLPLMLLGVAIFSTLVLVPERDESHVQPRT